MRKFFDSWLVRAFFAYALLAIIANVMSHSQPPAWLVPQNNSYSTIPPPVVGEPANPQGGNVENIRTRVITKVKHDTITVIKTDTVIKIDTLIPVKSFYNYTIYYEIVNRELAVKLGFLWDFSKTAQKTQLQSSDTTLFSLGNEKLREASYTYDEKGNKLQTYEKLVEGLDLRVNGRNANITYRTNNSLLFVSGKFDNTGLLMLSSDFEKRRYFLYFVPLDFLFGSEKYTLFLRVEKTEVE